MKQKYKMKRPEKLNLVPILDSVFIFIFFLLMSAQFVDVYEIGTSVPMLKEILNKPQENEPLNLTLEVTQHQIVVKTGLRVPVSRTFASEKKEELRQYLSELKLQNPNENTLIFRADKKISFQHLVTVIDSTQGTKEQKSKFFEQIVFDNNWNGQ